MVDLAPSGSIGLPEAYRRYCKWIWDGHDPRREAALEARVQSLPVARRLIHLAAQDQVTDLQLSDIVRLFSSGALEVSMRPQAKGELIIPPTAWREAFFAERLFLADEVGEGHGPAFDRAIGATPFVDTQKFEAILREKTGRRDSLPASLALRDLVIGLVMDGAMTPPEAEEFVHAWKLRAHSSRPPVGRFEPNKLPTWSLAMVVSWIVWRDPTKVRQAWEEYREECWEWFAFSRRCR